LTLIETKYITTKLLGFFYTLSTATILLNPVFGQTETKIPLMPSSGGIGSTNEGTGSVEMTG